MLVDGKEHTRQESPLYLAVRHGLGAIVELLLARGVSINAEFDEEDSTSYNTIGGVATKYKH